MLDTAHDTPALAVEAADEARSYTAVSWGECMKGIIPNASLVVIDPDREIGLGSLVAVVFKPEGPFNEFAQGLETQDLLGVFKVFLGALEDKSGPVYVFAQVNPPIIAPVRARSIEALHRIASVIPSEGDDDSNETRLQSALDLMGPFFQRCDPVTPINPAWRPPKPEEE